MKDLKEIVKDLDDEIERVKKFASENGYHHGTFLFPIIRRYREELKEMRKLIRLDLIEDKIKNYSDIEKK